MLTADHVVGAVVGDRVGIMFPPECGMRSTTLKADELRTALTQYRGKPDTTSVEVEPIGVVRCRESKLDVAAVEIAATVVPGWCGVYELRAQHEKSPQVGECAILVGLPTDAGVVKENAVQTIEQHCAYVSMALRVTEELEPTQWVQELSSEPAFFPALHFAMEFDQQRAGFSPLGMSGCAVWRIPSGPRVGRVWHPQLGLAGIQVSHNKARHALQATRVERICSDLFAEREA